MDDDRSRPDGRRQPGDRSGPDGRRGPDGAVRRAGERIRGLLGPYVGLILILVIGAVFTTILTSVAAEIYESVKESDDVAALDHPVLRAAVGMRSPVANTVVGAFTQIGGPIAMPIIAAAALLILAIRRRSWTPVILIAGAGIGSLLMTIAGKNLVGRARPPLEMAIPPFEHSPSFPSGHALNAIVIAGIIAYLLVLRRRSKRARALIIIVAALWAAAMGLSRVYLGLHWLTDVLAAWVLGAAWLTIVITAHRVVLYGRARRTNSR